MLSAKAITKVYYQGDNELRILKGIDIDVRRGEAICIVGASGAGKSTFLHILGTLDRPTSGHVYYEQEDLFSKSDKELAQFRNQNIGFVFQFHHLLSEFNAFDNVTMPGRLAKMSSRECRMRADELFALMGLSPRKTHFPSELSGGEQQRVAIARALFLKPDILMADEPTGNLDTQNSSKIQQMFFELKEEFNLTLIVVTHDRQFADKFPRVLSMADGQWA